MPVPWPGLVFSFHGRRPSLDCQNRRLWIGARLASTTQEEHVQDSDLFWGWLQTSGVASILGLVVEDSHPWLMGYLLTTVPSWSLCPVGSVGPVGCPVGAPARLERTQKTEIDQKIIPNDPEMALK